jgi:hypothetical protein
MPRALLSALARSLLPAVLALCSLGGCVSVRTVQRPYPQVENALLQRLDTAGKDLHASPQNVSIVSRELARCLGSRGVQVSDYQAGQHIHLRTEERYDIGGIGGNFLNIDLRRVDLRRTQVAVDYLDRAVGFLVIPFAYANPGWLRERKIASCLLRLEGVPPEADRVPPPAPPPPRLSEQACERIQGRSCGPPGYVIPCETAAGQHLRCICKGVLECR